jgi:hypothetical protein
MICTREDEPAQKNALDFSETKKAAEAAKRQTTRDDDQRAQYYSRVEE